jgi:ADP-ribose pyrophosphatase YjhB (NUDIX family)
LEANRQQLGTGSEKSNQVLETRQVDQPTHAGGVLLRKRGENLECLLVQAKGNADEWVLPKGHIEPGEKIEAAALREVKEETGVWACIDEAVGIVKYTSEKNQKKPERVTVRFYLMHAVGKGKREHRWRKVKWFPVAEAKARLARHTASQQALESARKRRSARQDSRDKL